MTIIVRVNIFIIFLILPSRRCDCFSNSRAHTTAWFHQVYLITKRTASWKTLELNEKTKLFCGRPQLEEKFFSSFLAIMRRGAWSSPIHGCNFCIPQAVFCPKKRHHLLANASKSFWAVNIVHVGEVPAPMSSNVTAAPVELTSTYLPFPVPPLLFRQAAPISAGPFGYKVRKKWKNRFVEDSKDK